MAIIDVVSLDGHVGPETEVDEGFVAKQTEYRAWAERMVCRR